MTKTLKHPNIILCLELILVLKLVQCPQNVRRSKICKFARPCRYLGGGIDGDFCDDGHDYW